MRAFGSFFDFVTKVQSARDELEALILAGAFDDLHANRRALIWAIPQALEFARPVKPSSGQATLPLEMPEPSLNLGIEDFTGEERAVHERALLDIDVAHHLMAFERTRVRERGVVSTEEARRMPAGTKLAVIGNPIRLRFPPTQVASGLSSSTLKMSSGYGM